MFWVKLLHPVVIKAAADKTRATIVAKTPAFLRRKRQKTHPKNMLSGSNRPASEIFRLCVPTFVADAPPLKGLFVSIVSCALATPSAASWRLGLEKWQVTPAGSDAQPSPMVSAKSPFEVR